MNCILLCLSQSDLSNLTNAARCLKAIGTQNIWLVYSPAICVSTTDATAVFDKEIADLEKAKAAAVGREDYEGARGHKLAIEGKQLDRKAAIADAWKKVSVEDRKKTAARLFQPFFEACGKDMAPIPYETEEHHDASDLPNILKKYEKARPFGHGNYGVVFSRGIGRNQPVAEQSFTPPPPPSIKAVIASKPDFDASDKFTPQQLEKLPHFSLLAVGKNRKVYAKGMPKDALIKAILDKDLAGV